MLPFLFKERKPIVGVVHLPPLPGSPRYRGASLEPVLDFARAQAKAFLDAGFDGLIVENLGDAPYFAGAVPPETTAALAVVAREVVALAGPAPVGVNVLRNDARAALAVAVIAGARFIRVNVHSGVAATDQGIVEGKAADTLRARELLRASGQDPGRSVAIWADAHVKHARPLDSDDVARAASDLAERGLADAILVSGSSTGHAPDAGHVERARRGAGHVPLLIASGLNARNCAQLVPLADGAVAASDALIGGRAGAPVDPDRARELVRAFRSA